LVRDVECEEARIDEADVVEDREDEHEAGALQPVVAAEAEDDAPLPLRGDADDPAQPDRHDERDDEPHRQGERGAGEPP
jgi:hypothetical protein